MKTIGVDVGGTFTDIVYCDLGANQIAIHKVSTTPDDPSRGVVTMFPGGPGPAIVPAKKITIRNPFSKKPKAEPSPTPHP